MKYKLIYQENCYLSDAMLFVLEVSKLIDQSTLHVKKQVRPEFFSVEEDFLVAKDIRTITEYSNLYGDNRWGKQLFQAQNLHLHLRAIHRGIELHYKLNDPCSVFFGISENLNQREVDQRDYVAQMTGEIDNLLKERFPKNSLVLKNLLISDMTTYPALKLIRDAGMKLHYQLPNISQLYLKEVERLRKKL